MTSCYANPYTNEATSSKTDKNTGRLGESNPRHDVHSIGCCHYTRSADFRTQAEEEGLEPSPPDRAAAFSKRVRRNRYSPLFQTHSHAPARNRTWTSSFARSRGHPFHHGDSTSVIHHISPPGLEPGTQRSKRRMIIHFNTGMSLSSLLATTGYSLSNKCPHLRRPP